MALNREKGKGASRTYPRLGNAGDVPTIGRPVIAYRYVQIQHDSHSGGNEAFFELESLESSLGALKPHEKWIGVEELPGLKPDHYGIIHDCLLYKLNS
jgi:hypothetical protein